MYPAKQMSPRRSVALKIMHPRDSTDNTIASIEKRELAFQTEIAILSTPLVVSVPWAIKMHKYGRISNDLFHDLPIIVLELLDLRNDLQHRSQRRNATFSMREGYNFCAQFYTLLARVHACSIAYTDFQPRHLFWDGKRMKIIDWNISVMNSGSEQRDNDLEGFIKVASDFLPAKIMSLLLDRSTALEALWHVVDFGKKQGFQRPSSVPTTRWLAKEIASTLSDKGNPLAASWPNKRDQGSP
ncbi:hypothetical protein HY772_04920 [Candidatus Woesearchaeota archaeon]|nr:hypothetical protein [Candidatus Woesearchaeota archaeon]